MTEQSSAEQRYRDDENAWLITLPEKRNGAHFFQALTLVAIRTISDVYYPAAVSVEDRSPRRLVRRECELKLYWRGGGWHQEKSFLARYTINLYDGTTQLNLTNSDFILDYELRGRGLGSWIMQQLVSWAKSLPSDTPVKSIRTGPADEEDAENHARRDRFWHGLGFRFALGSRSSLPLSVGELQLPAGSGTKPDVTLLQKGVHILTQTNDLYRLKLEANAHALKASREEIARLTRLQPHMLLIQLISAPFTLLSWFVHQVKRHSAARHAQQKDTHPDDHEG
ncbi:hypothetical protein ACN5L5_004102 [Cronobacter turicensis]|uniref:Uncharacterized protein n=3 Tax=Pseudomonadati TaxID=3379134 RepID=A0A2T7B0L4_9ENTR|nr:MULTISPECIES: hypothetical protein [Cronobacter]EKA1098039.1 hypothetical protein [Cronobacter sakazakii]EKK4066475.1 hypothetical protein [Cronobacter sakazakii]EKK7700268.1 hypothetical protein [Cronobacter sakazakii]EKY3090686.1 hypothetical protein [Cronobacter dublinensis]ELQ6002127.1 hypothetical protein [Cronobacter turicensis]